MRIIGCDLHARQQTISMVDTETGEVTEKTLAHEGETVREFYAALPKPVLVGLEATGSMFWFLLLGWTEHFLWNAPTARSMPVRGNAPGRMFEYRFRPARAKDSCALAGRADRFRNPGRCPGLECGGTFSAGLKIVQIRIQQS